jgi:diguanylate cyclase (GGDEF)-like protein
MTPSDAVPDGPPPRAEPGFADDGNRLAAALMDSRARWRDLALLAADLLFETDGEGRLTFLAPDRPLGHDAGALLGAKLATLLAEGEAEDPFAGTPPHGRRLWLRTAAGGCACLEFRAQRVGVGLRGIARDVTEEERHAELAARTLRRATAMTRLLGAAQRSRTQGGAAGAGIARLLDGIGPALGATGAALLEEAPDGWRSAVRSGAPGPLPPPDAVAPLREGALALVPVGPGLALAAWREPALDEEELGLLAALGPPLAGLQTEAARQRELDAAARTDPLTGLLNRRGFAAALEESRTGQPEGVLAYLDMDGLKRLNDRHGHAVGDAAIRAIAARLAAARQDGAVAARLGGDEFALWLPGATLEEARARCAPLGAPGPLAGLPEAGEAAVAASLGLAAATAEDGAEALLQRADVQMYRRKTDRRAA